MTTLVFSFILLVSGLTASYWLWANHWHNLTVAIQLQFSQFDQMVKSMTATSYIWLVVGLVILQEMAMIFCRYCLGLQGKKERFYVLWRGQKFGIHHLHWGLAIIAVGAIGELTNTHSNLLLIAIGGSCVLSDLLQHRVLELLYGDPEGDGEWRNPFRRKRQLK